MFVKVIYYAMVYCNLRYCVVTVKCICNEKEEEVVCLSGEGEVDGTRSEGVS